jgi:hypothetical protein
MARIASNYRGETRPRRQASMHHISVNAALHRKRDVSDPFPPISTKQFPALYTRSPIKNQYRSYMRTKSAYKKPKF